MTTTSVEDRRLGAAIVVIAAVWAAVGLFAVHTQLPSNPVQLPGQQRLHTDVQRVIPQGWAFFTKSPRERFTTAWRPAADGGWEEAMLAPHSEPRNVFGLNRRSRAQAVEIGMLSVAVPQDRWRDCPDGDVPACLAGSGPGDTVRLRNDSPAPILCGAVGLSRREPLPWAWADAAGVTSMPASVLRLEVRC